MRSLNKSEFLIFDKQNLTEFNRNFDEQSKKIVTVVGNLPVHIRSNPSINSLTSSRREYFWFSQTPMPYRFIIGQKPENISSH